MGAPYSMVSRDAQVALTEFSNEFIAALTQGPVNDWSRQFGLNVPFNGSLRTVFPIAIGAAGYHELKGDLKYRRLAEKSLEIKSKTWQDGITELAEVIEAPDFIGWMEQPAAIAAAGQSLPNDIIAGLIEANPVGYDGKNFFASDHPVNVFDTSMGTFDNDYTGAGTDPSLANLALAMAGFDQMVGPNGQPAGYRMTHVFHPPSQTQKWKELLERDLIIAAGAGSTFGAVNNIYKGAVIPVPLYELSNTTQWYPASIGAKPGAYPWIVQAEDTPEEIRRDKTSDYYAETLKVSIAYVLRANGVLALPQTMQRWAGTP